MSRATVRAAFEAFLTPATVAGMAAFHRSPPRIIQGQEFTPTAGTASGAVVSLHIASDEEKRVAYGGATSGEKLVTYKAVLIVMFISRQQDAQAAMDDFDSFVESLKERLRSDRTLGTAGSANPIFQAGEGTGLGTPDIVVACDLPRQDKGSTYIWATCDVTVSEMIAS